MRNAYRTAQVKAEVAQIEAEIARKAATKKYEADRPAREAAAQQAEFERRALKKRLLLDPAESQDFVYTKYDGRFPDAASVERAIRASWAAFLANHDLDRQAQNTVTLFLQSYPQADISLPETFEKAHDYLVRRLNPTEAPATVPVQTAPVTVDRYESTRQEIADLRARAEKCAFASKERDDLERRAYGLEVKLEVLGNDDYQSVMQEIVEQSGKVLSGAHSLQFRQWLASPIQSRRYGANPTAQNIRFAFSEWSGDSSFLLSSEREEIQRRANVRDYSSEDIKNIVGFRNDYGIRTAQGIRQGGQ
jgi:hypothetical protein